MWNANLLKEPIKSVLPNDPNPSSLQYNFKEYYSLPAWVMYRGAATMWKNYYNYKIKINSQFTTSTRTLETFCYIAILFYLKKINLQVLQLEEENQQEAKKIDEERIKNNNIIQK